MKPAPFDYVRASDGAEVLDVLHRQGADARILAGGQSLLPMLNMRLARPAVLVDIMHVPSLQSIADDGTALRIGAAVRQAELEARPDLARRQKLLAAALPWIGHAQTRSRGTVCGSVAHADPSAELPLLLVALGGTVHLRSRRRHRAVEAGAFFTGMMATDRADDELIEAVSIPTARPGAGYAFREIGRRHGDFAIVACAAVVENGRARLGIGGVADRPVAQDMPGPDDEALDEALDAFAWALEARDDLHATARYRRELVRRLGRATIEEAARCRA
ncbi:MAG: FAD binding domain-containing protein [Acidisphaera sp.]|nr:FAD binding domain-containing protein [Acidisphaera sp.]